VPVAGPNDFYLSRWEIISWLGKMPVSGLRDFLSLCLIGNPAEHVGRKSAAPSAA
jgi:hypothetical protein